MMGKHWIGINDPRSHSSGNGPPPPGMREACWKSVNGAHCKLRPGHSGPHDSRVK